MRDVAHIEIVKPVVRAAQHCCKTLAPFVAETASDTGARPATHDQSALYKLHVAVIESLFRCMIGWGVAPGALKELFHAEDAAAPAIDDREAERLVEAAHADLAAALHRALDELEAVDVRTLDVRRLLQDYADRIDADLPGAGAGKPEAGMATTGLRQIISGSMVSAGS
ncbi:MAG: hypothetical protein KDE35_03520 [Geminicoccaceae bacterium]|nr:hypothetical protein [Geminicoccaceae bacterium]